MRKFFIFLFCLCTTCLLAEEAYVILPVADIQEKPERMSEVGSQAIYGTVVEVLEKNDTWTKIKKKEGTIGWINSSSLVRLAQPYPSTQTVGKVKTLWMHCYYVADTTPFPPACTLPFDTKVEVITPPAELNQRWVQARLIDGSIYYVQVGDLEINPKILSLDEMIALSSQFLRIPYRWGGASSFGFDCSGFTQMLYGQMGILLPHSSRQQATMGVEVTRETLNPGDLLFFGREKKITHVGMYLGDNHFIHAHITLPTIVGGIIISDLTSEYWSSLFVTARRIYSR